MRKFYVGKADLNSEELKTGCVSYRRIIDRYTDGEIVLCNNINGLDNSIWENICGEYEEDLEVYQYYLCNLNEYQMKELVKCGVIVSYSNMLDLDVIMVDHYGTSWDYVMMDVEWTTEL